MYYLLPSQKRLHKIYRDLVKSAGMRVCVDDIELLKCIEEGRPWEAAQAMAKHMGLPISIMYTVVDDTSLMHSTGGNATQVPAQVSIPTNLPLYGSEELKGFAVEVRFARSFQKRPLQLLVCIAHELAHVYLFSTGSRYKTSERETDITAMLLGFWKVYQKGRKSEHGYSGAKMITRMGYLSDREFAQVIRLIKHDHRRFASGLYRLRKLKNRTERKVAELERSVTSLEENINRISKHPPKRVSRGRQRKISQLLHEPPQEEATKQISEIRFKLLKVDKLVSQGLVTEAMAKVYVQEIKKVRDILAEISRIRKEILTALAVVK